MPPTTSFSRVPLTKMDAPTSPLTPFIAEPPNAPGVINLDVEGRFIQRLRNHPGVRPKFRFYTPEDVMEIDSVETLQWLWDKYNPMSQPVSIYEAAYLELVRSVIREKLNIPPM